MRSVRRYSTGGGGSAGGEFNLNLSGLAPATQLSLLVRDMRPGLPELIALRSVHARDLRERLKATLNSIKLSRTAIHAIFEQFWTIAREAEVSFSGDFAALASSGAGAGAQAPPTVRRVRGLDQEGMEQLMRGQEGVSPIFKMLVPTAGVGGAGAGAAAGGGAGGAQGDVQEPPNKRSK